MRRPTPYISFKFTESSFGLQHHSPLALNLYGNSN